MTAPSTKPNTKLVRPLRSGQITIPIAFRRELGIGEDSVLAVTLEAGELRIKPLTVRATTEESPWFQKLYEYFAPARQEAEEQGYTDDQINAWIDEAVAEVRAKHG